MVVFSMGLVDWFRNSNVSCRIVAGIHHIFIH